MGKKYVVILGEAWDIWDIEEIDENENNKDINTLLSIFLKFI